MSPSGQTETHCERRPLSGIEVVVVGGETGSKVWAHSMVGGSRGPASKVWAHTRVGGSRGPASKVWAHSRVGGSRGPGSKVWAHSRVGGSRAPGCSWLQVSRATQTADRSAFARSKNPTSNIQLHEFLMQKLFFSHCFLGQNILINDKVFIQWYSRANPEGRARNKGTNQRQGHATCDV